MIYISMALKQSWAKYELLPFKSKQLLKVGLHCGFSIYDQILEIGFIDFTYCCLVHTAKNS